MEPGDIQEINYKFTHAVNSLNLRCLFKSSKWLCEQLIGLEDISPDSSSEIIQNSDDYQLEPFETILSASVVDRNYILFAQSLISSGEYQRCSHFLLNSTQLMKNRSSSVALFLGYYSLYMAGEKIKDQNVQESIILDSPTWTSKSSTPAAGKSSTEDQSNSKQFSRNFFLKDLYSSLAAIYTSDENKMDGFLLYLFAVISRDLGRQDGIPSQQLHLMEQLWETQQSRVSEAPAYIPPTRELFLAALATFPYNWSCWLEFAEYCIVENSTIPAMEEIINRRAAIMTSTPTEEMLVKIMYLFFYCHINIERQNGDEVLKCIDHLLPIFPRSNFLISQTALAHYAVRDYDLAQETFEIVRSNDPFRLEHIDTFSNILYVKECHAELSHLAHIVSKFDKYTPECCCVIGNYYSLKGQHENAITYFTRALKINSKYLSAWTLMGHECVEIRNTAAAVQCYRRAVQLNNLDYRAWYGLGQTYEMLHMYQYALHYYKRASSIRPNDARMWCAVGNSYQKLNNIKNAMEAYERAVSADDREGIATRELARLYRENNNMDGAARCYLQHWISNNYVDTSYRVQRVMEDLDIDVNLAEAILYIANFFRKRDDAGRAEEYYTLLLDYVGPEGEEARAMLRQLRSTFPRTGVISDIPMPLNSLSNNSAAKDASASCQNQSFLSLISPNQIGGEGSGARHPYDNSSFSVISPGTAVGLGDGEIDISFETSLNNISSMRGATRTEEELFMQRRTNDRGASNDIGVVRRSAELASSDRDRDDSMEESGAWSEDSRILHMSLSVSHDEDDDDN